jgi:hypothetical protein
VSVSFLTVNRIGRSMLASLLLLKTCTGSRRVPYERMDTKGDEPS